MVSLNGPYWLSERERFSALAYYRNNRTRTLNGDVNDASRTRRTSPE